MKIGLALLGTILVIAGAYIFYNFSPYDSGVFPRCPVFVATGYQCTGCGSQRAIHDLLHLRFASAFASNPFAVLAIPYLLIGYVAEWRAPRSAWWARFRRGVFGTKAIWLILAIIVVFTVGRNVV
ncbi:MAG: DUF2752 domain-containing protein [Saprospiraceae bacterium]